MLESMVQLPAAKAHLYCWSFQCCLSYLDPTHTLIALAFRLHSMQGRVQHRADCKHGVKAL